MVNRLNSSAMKGRILIASLSGPNSGIRTIVMGHSKINLIWILGYQFNAFYKQYFFKYKTFYRAVINNYWTRFS